MSAEPYWDPYDAAIRRNPYDAWRRLRDDAPAYYNAKYDFWALTRFDDVLAASIDTGTFSSAYGITLDTVGKKPAHPIMIMLDPPQHDVLRKLVSPMFTPRRMRALEDGIRELCAGYLDPFVGSGGFDYVRDFGMRLPVMVISSLLGFPKEDHEMLREWSDAALYREEGQEGFTEIGKKAMEESQLYYWNAVQERRRAPREDLISQILATEFEELDGSRRTLDDIETMGMISLISAAGNETVARHLGWAAVVYAEWPAERKKLVDDPSLVTNAVEELLRFEAPSPIQGRYVTRDVEMHGVTIPQGSTMALLTGSAGRDERRYPEADRFDVQRKLDRHVTLGYGAHYCLGAALARLEGRVGVEETLKRFPEWDVDRSAVQYVETNTVRGPSSCPIRF
ncbi:MAG: cytochrome P450 [Deltaproteobacteria bacterium]|nr:cytochrome P450 [Deltaproteobacteria bacterium]